MDSFSPSPGEHPQARLTAAAQPPSDPVYARSVLGQRLLVVTGKGGTGRSAVAASLAAGAARRGARVLAVALDDGGGLAAHLGVPALGTTPTAAGDVQAARVEPAAALEEYLRIRIGIPRVAGAGRIFSAVADTVPGVRDTVMIGKVLHEATSDEWDVVVVDGPPTGQITSYLHAPRTIAGLVPAGVVRRQAETMEAALGDPTRTGLVIVATPEELPVIEAIALRDEVTADGSIAIGMVVANRVLPPAAFTAADARAARGRRGDAARHHLAMSDQQRAHLAALGPDIELPLLFGVHTADEVTARLSTEWDRP